MKNPEAARFCALVCCLFCANSIISYCKNVIRIEKWGFMRFERWPLGLQKTVFGGVKGHLLHLRMSYFIMLPIPIRSLDVCKWLGGRLLCGLSWEVLNPGFCRETSGKWCDGAVPGTSNVFHPKSEWSRKMPFPHHSDMSSCALRAAKFFIVHYSLFIKNMYFCTAHRHIHTWKLV